MALALVNSVHCSLDDVTERGGLLAAYAADFPSAVSIDLRRVPRKEHPVVQTLEDLVVLWSHTSNLAATTDRGRATSSRACNASKGWQNCVNETAVKNRLAFWRHGREDRLGARTRRRDRQTAYWQSARLV